MCLVIDIGMMRRLRALFRASPLDHRLRPRCDTPHAQSKPKRGMAAQDALFEALEEALRGGASLAPLTEIDRFVDERQPGIFLKHDVHDVDLDGVVAFAEREARLGIRGTYFFMPPGHPRTRETYGFTDQAKCMVAIERLGHEVGLHVDPYYQIHAKGQPLRAILQELRAAFEGCGVTLRIGNMHGNSGHKHLDMDGYGTSFDLFDELGRQPDFPHLERVPPETAELIRTHRVSLVHLGFTHWGDLPVWSARHGFIATNFLTDNGYGKRGTFELIVWSDTLGSYRISPRQPPGSRNRAQGCLVPTVEPDPSALPLREHIGLEGGDVADRLARPGRIMPLLVLIHPEFYC